LSFRENLFIPIGGGNEIGASCYLYIVGGKKIVVDAGVRFSQKEPFPDFNLLKNLAPKLDAIVITHAHADHCASFHILSSLYPETPIYTTYESAQLLALMVEDAIKVRYIRDKNSPLELKEYRLLDEALSRIERRNFFDRIDLGGVELELLPAGHILGAASVVIRFGDGDALFHTSDISLKPSETTQGAVLPQGEKIKLLVSESTYYYAKKRFNREESRRELFKTLLETYERRGKLLIPVFALGRAQEILLTIRRGIEEGELPPLSIYVDGLAREVSNIYENLLEIGIFNYFIQPAPRYEGLSFEESCEENLREADCILSTSGMLMEGTPSYFYAKILSKRKESAIAFSGYLVEESFGYRLLNDRKLLKSFKCKITRHHFSAHSGAEEIAEIAQRLSPEKRLFVHGYPPPKNYGEHAYNAEVVRF